MSLPTALPRSSRKLPGTLSAGTETAVDFLSQYGIFGIVADFGVDFYNFADPGDFAVFVQCVYVVWANPGVCA